LFITLSDDFFDSEDEDTQEYPAGIVRFGDLANETPDVEHFYERLYDRAVERGCSNAAFYASMSAQHGTLGGLNKAEMLVFQLYDDPALYRVRCRVRSPPHVQTSPHKHLQHGCELDVIMFILQLADPSKHNIRAAFTHGEGTGHIYIEGAMDAEVQQLLRLIPGLLFSSGRPHLDSIPIGRVLYEQVPPSDAGATLKLPEDMGYESEQWVKILRGRYKGDIAFVLSVERTGRATVLLVPRLQPPISGLTAGKRKRPGSIPRPPPQLFVPRVVEAAFEAKPKKRRDGMWHFKGSTYDHGLLRKKINPGAAIPFGLVPTNFGIQFAYSSHPVFTSNPTLFPCPVEWEFSPNETVNFLTS
jgi:hypothetical protein